MEDEIVVESGPPPQSHQSQPPFPFQTLDQPPERQFSLEEETLDQGMQEPQPQEVEEEEEDEDPQDMDFSPAGKKWKPPPTGMRRDTAQEKLGFLMNNLQPVPFAPGKTLDFAGHEALFRALGLWDFTHLDLDGGAIRRDLLALLIANYDPSARCSFVNNVRIGVSRADLARALCLPVKNERGGLFEGRDGEREFFARVESVTVVMDFMSNWVLFHGDEACVLPAEVVAATQLVRDGQPQKVDWARLMWIMVEKELLEVSGVCYYASHLQCLMKHQKPTFFEEEDLMEVTLAEGEEDAIPGVVSVENVEDSVDLDVERKGVRLTLSLAGDGDFLGVDIRECKESEKGQWFCGLQNVDGEHCLRPCNLNDVQSLDCEDLVRGGEAGIGEEELFVDDSSTNFSNLERLNSTDHLQAINTVIVSYSLPSQPLVPSAGELVASSADALQSAALDTCTGISSLFGSSGKRAINEFADVDDVDDGHFSLGDHQKRMRMDAPRDHTLSAFETCADQVQAWVGKAKIVYAQKEQDAMSAQLQLQCLSSMLQQKDQLIQSMEKSRLEEQCKWQLSIYQFERELSVMAQIIQGYKKALLKTRHSFAEYRKKFPQGDEPLYKDLYDVGRGTLLTTRELERKHLAKVEELEKKQLVKEEANCCMLQMMDDFERKCFDVLGGHATRVYKLEKGLKELMGKSSLQNKGGEKSKVADEIVEKVSQCGCGYVIDLLGHSCGIRC